MVSHKRRMLSHYSCNGNRPAIGEVGGERFHWVFNKKRTSKGCDAPLSLLCSVCKNSHKKGKESKCTKLSLTKQYIVATY